MGDGSVRYGAFVNPDGMMIDDGNVYRFAEDRFWVMINSPGIDDWFRETAEGLDASIAHKTLDLAMIAVQGPTSQATLQPLTERDLDELSYFRFWPEMTTVAGVAANVLRTGFSGEHGYELVLEPSDAQVVWDALIAAGATPFGLNAIDLARTEVGLIIIAVDYDPGERSPWDLSMDRFIKTDTECVGAQALAAYGANPPKRFKTLRVRRRRARSRDGGDQGRRRGRRGHLARRRARGWARSASRSWTQRSPRRARRSRPAAPPRPSHRCRSWTRTRRAPRA